MTDDLTPQRLEAIKKLGITRETAAGLFVSVEEHAEALSRIEELEAESSNLKLRLYNVMNMLEAVEAARDQYAERVHELTAERDRFADRIDELVARIG